MVYFTLPNFYKYNIVNNRLFLLSKSHPEYFKFDYRIICSEGNFPYAYWSTHYFLKGESGRITQDMIGGAYDNYLELIFDVSNPLLNEYDLYNTKLDIFLSYYQTHGVSVVVSDPKIMNIISERYSFVKFIGSELYPIFDPDLKYIDKLERLRCDLRTINDYVGIPKNKLEIAVTNICSDCINYDNCLKEDVKNHYNFSERQIYQECPKSKVKFLSDTQMQNFIKQGYKYYNITCYNYKSEKEDEAINLYVKFFIKPEYQDTVNLILRGAKND